MNEINREALVLFKDNSLLVLKNMLVQKTTELTLPEIEILEKAIEYHRNYNHTKLQKAKLKKEIVNGK